MAELSSGLFRLARLLRFAENDPAFLWCHFAFDDFAENLLDWSFLSAHATPTFPACILSQRETKGVDSDLIERVTIQQYRGSCNPIPYGRSREDYDHSRHEPWKRSVRSS